MPKNSDSRMRHSRRSKSRVCPSYRPLLESLEERLLLANDFYRVPGVPGETVKLQFQLTGKGSIANNELGIYLVDDSQGRVNGLLPHQEGYAQAAASRAEQVFAQTSSVGNRKEIFAEAGQQFAYLMVRQGTLQQWSDQNPENRPEQTPLLMFSVDLANPQGLDAVRTRTSTSDITQVRWEDSLATTRRLFDDQIFTIRPMREAVLKIPGQFGQAVTTQFTLVGRFAKFRNEVGYFLADDTLGSINGFSPGDPGYSQAALASETRQVIFSNTTRVGAVRRNIIPSQSNVVFYMVQNNTTANFLRRNPNNLPRQGPLAFFSISQANPDFIEHKKWFNFRTFGFEDILGGGDRDFNDIMVRIAMSAPQGPVSPPETDPPLISASLVQDTAPGGTTNNDTITFNPEVQGTITDQSRITSFRAGLNDTSLQQFANITSRLNSDGTFIIDRPLLNQLAGGFLSDGPHTLKLIASDQFNNTSAIYSVPFVLDTQIDLNVDLSAHSDTPPVGDLKTSLSVISLTGMTDPGANVRLVGTTLATTANSGGNYTLNGIGLSAGFNTFTIHATDIAGNERIASITVEYEPVGDCGFDDQLTGWRVEESGGTPVGKGYVSVQAGSATIHEGDSYLVSLSKEFIIPDSGNHCLSIEFTMPQFDTAAQNLLRDAFEIAFVDVSGNSLVLPYMVTRDAYYNFTEGQTPILAPGVDESFGRLHVNLAGVVPGTAGRLYFRLFNNDGDTQSQVTIHCARMEEDPTLLPPSGSLGTDQLLNPLPVTVDSSRLVNVSNSIRAEYGTTSYFAEAFTAYSTLSLRNTGTYGIGGTVIVILDQLSDPTVVPQGIDGLLPDGRAYYNFSHLLHDKQLEPGTVSLPTALKFYTPSNRPFTYQLTVLAEPNRPPTFISEPYTDVVPGRSYTYQARATDPDGDIVRYQLLAGPIGLNINSHTGLVTWIPSADQHGNHTVVIQAEDGRGGEAAQWFTISVGTENSNRPPVITSTPVVDALVSAEYRYTVLAVDPDFDPISFSLIQGPVGMIIEPATGILLWQPLDMQLGQHVVVVRASDGQGGEVDQTYNVTVRQAAGNHPPIILSEPPATHTHRQADGTYITSFVSGMDSVGRDYIYPVTAIDADHDVLLYALLEAPAGMTIHPESGLIEWRARPQDQGQHLVTVQVSDGRGGRDTQRFVINVIAAGGSISGYKYLDYSWQGSIPGTAHPWLAGAPGGTLIGTNDRAPFQSPVQAGINVQPGQVLRFQATGSTSHLPVGGVGPDGSGFITYEGEFGLSGTVVPRSALVGVFLTHDWYDNWSTSPMLDFSPTGNVPGGIDYEALAPQLWQVFFIGDGFTSDGTQQRITVPEGAHRLFLGTMDDLEWKDNTGSLDVTISVTQFVPNVILSDGTFHPDHWTFAQGPIHDGNPDLSGPIVVTSEHRVSGGNPGANQYIRQFFRAGDFTSVVGSSNNLVYNPQTQGAISFLAASIDIYQFHVEEPGQIPAGTFWKIMVEQNGIRYYDKQVRYASDNFNFWQTFSVTGLRETDFDTNLMVGFQGGTIPSTPTGLHPDFSALGAPLTFGIVDCNASVGLPGAPLGTAIAFDNLKISLYQEAPPTPLAGFIVYLDQNNNGIRDPGEIYQVTNSQGYYEFPHLPEGQYIVREDGQPIVSQSFLYADGDFVPAHWHDAVVLVRDGNPNLSGPTMVGPFQATSDGNPGNYRFQADDFRIGDLLATSHINTRAVYNPRIQGSIASMDFAIDLKQFPPRLPGQGPGGTAFTLAVMQNGIVYYGTPFSNNQTTWQRRTFTGITTEHFDSNILPEEREGNHPDFSANGAPLTLGYGHWIVGSGTPGFRILNEFGIDNWEVTIHNVGQSGLWEQSSPNNPPFYAVNLLTGQSVTGKNFSNRKIADAGPIITSNPIRDGNVGTLYRYDAEVIGSGNITWDLPQRPAGMSIDSARGIIAWLPGEEQEGFHTVVVRARDGQGRSTLQSFTVHVQPGNSPPAFLSLPTQQAALLRPWQYHALAVDAENDPLHFTLIQGPTGMSMSSSGLVHWIPSVGQLGNHPVQLKVSDGQGGEAFQQFTLTVVTSLQNTNPTLSGSPRTSVRIGDRYYAQFIGIDAEGDPLTYSLPVSPLGMSIDNQGRIEFVPEAYQFGLHPVTVRVEDGQGGVAETSFTLNVVGQEVNHAPVITSTAPLAATLNRSYRYAPTFFDADGDPVIWSLLTKPLGMAVDPLTGIIHWQPANDQLGMHTVVLQATDPMLASTTQAFTLLVRGNNTPPLILSTAITDAAVQQDYEYRVIAQDAEGEMLNYALLTAPDGMVIDPVTGIIHWLPASGQVGNHTVQVSVNDEQGGQAVQTYTIVVSANRFNRPPSITSLPPLKASIDRLYSYQIEAIDPENDAINFALLNGPAGMSVNSVTGQLSWIPLSAQIGSHLVTVGARDASGIYGQQTYRVSVIENQVPVISSTPVTNATSGTAYYYDVAALDPDGDALTYSLVQFQPGMTIDSFGRLRWQVPQAQGTVPVHIVVTDGRGGEATQTYQITVTGDTQAPQVHATLEPNPAVVGSSVLIRVNATDNDRIDSLVLRVNGIVIPLAADGTARLDAMMTGNFPVQITAIDPAGNQGQFTTNLIVHDEDNPTGLGPDIIIISPSNNASITNLVDLVGSITSDSGISYWSVSLAPIGSNSFHQLASGTGIVNDDILARIDPTLLANDQYLVRVIARDTLNRTSKSDIYINIYGDLKLGRYRDEFIDLTIPLAGIPIEIRRVYDTLNAGVKNDFGYGWTLSIADPRIRETVPQHVGIGFFGREAAPFKVGTKVYLTTPTGKRVGFTLAMDAVGVPFFGVFYRPRFVADPGVFEKLDVLTQPDNPFGDLYVKLPDGTFTLPLAIFGGRFNPDNYNLTMTDGTIYRYHQQTGLKEVVDSSGNKRTFTANGITSNFGVSVQFLRDAKGRITEIIDPQGNRLRYSYNADGNLVTYADQLNQLTRYEYLTQPAHYLSKIIDPRGNVALQMDYDPVNRRATGLVDASGLSVISTFDLENMTESYMDRRGNVTTVRFDTLGNIVEVVDALGGKTRNVYNSDSRLISTTDANNHTTFYTYDAQGNRTSMTDALGHRTQWEYDLRNNLIRATDALGHVLTFIYDERNRQIARIDQRGILFTTGYDAFGRVTVRTDAACCGGESRQFVYDQPFNQPSRIIYANGAVEQYVYNGMGLLLRFTDANQLVTEFSYNSAGLPVSVRNPSGQLTWYTYDANGSMTSLTDSLNQRTEFQYDSLDRLVAVIDANQQSIRYEYDANNNRTAVIDRNGNRIAYAYDELNRLVQETWWSDTTLERTIYTTFDPVGNRLSILDSDAYLQFEYDSLNRVIRSDDGDLHGKPRTILEYYYDAIGNRIATSDNYGTIVDALFTPSRKIQQLQWQGNGINPVRIEYAYDVADRVKIISRYPNLFTSLPASSSYFTRDAVGNLTELTHRNAADQVLSSYSYTYDAGRRLMSSFINGLETNYSYNAVGELLEADRSSGIDEHYSYDSNGNRVLSHLHAHYTTGTNNQLLTDGVYSYSYDQEGQLTTKTSLSTGEVVTYSYDHRHRLIEVTTRSASQVILSTVAYRYDALDRRIAQVTNGNTIFTAYNDMNVWADFAEAGNILSRYLTGNELDQMLARHQFATGMVWYLTDSLGSVREQISTGGLLRNRITYDSFGNVLSQTNPTFGDRFLFTGREYSAESKLYYYRARYYDPQIGRFISQDPILFKGGDVNLYRYVNNNPLSITDPTGMTAGAEYGSIQRLKALEAYYLRRQIINAKQASCLLRFVIGHLGDMAGVPSLPGQTYWEFLICMSQSWVVP